MHFALFPSSSYWPVLPFKEDYLLDLVSTLSKNLVDSLGAGLSFGSFKFLDPFHFGLDTSFSCSRRTYGPRLKIDLDAMYITYTLSKIGEIISLWCIHT